MDSASGTVLPDLEVAQDVAQEPVNSMDTPGVDDAEAGARRREARDEERRSAATADDEVVDIDELVFIPQAPVKTEITPREEPTSPSAEPTSTGGTDEASDLVDNRRAYVGARTEGGKLPQRTTTSTGILPSGSISTGAHLDAGMEGDDTGGPKRAAGESVGVKRASGDLKPNQAQGVREARGGGPPKAAHQPSARIGSGTGSAAADRSTPPKIFVKAERASSPIATLAARSGMSSEASKSSASSASKKSASGPRPAAPLSCSTSPSNISQRPSAEVKPEGASSSPQGTRTGKGREPLTGRPSAREGGASTVTAPKGKDPEQGDGESRGGARGSASKYSTDKSIASPSEKQAEGAESIGGDGVPEESSHPPAGRKYKCPDCFKIYVAAGKHVTCCDGLPEDAIVESGKVEERSLRCSRCRHTFVRQKAFDHHVKNHIRKEEDAEGTEKETEASEAEEDSASPPRTRKKSKTAAAGDVEHMQEGASTHSEGSNAPPGGGDAAQPAVPAPDPALVLGWTRAEVSRWMKGTFSLEGDSAELKCLQLLSFTGRALLMHSAKELRGRLVEFEKKEGMRLDGASDAGLSYGLEAVLFSFDKHVALLVDKAKQTCQDANTVAEIKRHYACRDV